MCNKVYIPKHFAAFELVDKETYKLFEHHPELIFNLFNPDVLKWADWMRDEYGKMFINDWYFGGNIQWRGLRNKNSPDFSITSQHSCGEALDLYPLDMSAQEIITDLKKFGKVPYVTRIEDKPDMTWIHGDNKPTKQSGTYFFKP